ncbi:Uncharacterised protein [BD1-7 clade bacterium]|uniref:Uncharacterized protein n=1 Tax=BD1-7 clade bacterium TaxID=2029982 RepID=A0A5S9QJ15_9GAMM|nr:Uncharacterised protein [BD1-7 clade bacterium]CAA0117577.1 Uncharacterised protein [BD1-7 clade bacterium]
MPEIQDRKVIDFFSGKALQDLAQEKIIRLAPELDGLSMLYSNESNPDTFFDMKILCWGLKWNGEVVGLVPWLNQIVPCTEIKDPLNGSWDGYYDKDTDTIFYDAPMHKVVELETAFAYFDDEEDDDITERYPIQKIPDAIGTHAMLMNEDSNSLILTEVNSWQLMNDGTITAMLPDPKKVTTTPILMDDECLYRSDEHPQFRYYFQHHIANQLKNKDPEALDAIALLLEREQEAAQNPASEKENNGSENLEHADNISAVQDAAHEQTDPHSAEGTSTEISTQEPEESTKEQTAELITLRTEHAHDTDDSARDD